MSSTTADNRSRRLAILAAGLMIASAFCFRPGAGDAELALAVIFWLAGGGALGGALYLPPRPPLQSGAGEKTRSRAVLRAHRDALLQHPILDFIIAGIGFVCLMVMAEGNSPRGTMHFHTQFVLWCLGIALVTVGMSGVWRVNLTPRPPLQPGEGEKIQSRAAAYRVRAQRAVSLREKPEIRWRTAWMPSLQRNDFLIVLGLTLLAFLLRTVALETFVHHFVDELNFTDAIVQLWDANRDINILTRHGFITSFPWIYPYFQAISVEIFGPSLVAMRLVSAIFGTLTVPALYLLAKHLFDRRTALLAALLLTTFPPHIHFSRLGMNNIVDPFFGTLALAFLARASDTNHRRDWALAGAALGLTQYFYEGGKLIFPLLALAYVAVMVIGRREKKIKESTQRREARKGAKGIQHRDTEKKSRRESIQRLGVLASWRFNFRASGGLTPWRGIGIFALTACLVVAPLYYTLLVWHSSYLPRVESQQVGSDYWATLLTGTNSLEQIRGYFDQQLKPALLHFIHLPDTNRAFYGGETALILPYMAPFFLLGIVHLMGRWRKAAVILLPWVLLTAMGNSLLKDPAWSARFVVALPALPLMMAVGIHDTGRLIFPRNRTRTAWMPSLQGTLKITLAAMIAFQVAYYFGPHLRLFNVQVRYTRDQYDVMYRVRDFPPGTHVFILGDELAYPPHNAILSQFWHLDLHIQSRHPLELMLWGLHRLPGDDDIAFFIEPDDPATLDYLAGIFELQGPFYSPYNVPRDRQYVLYYVARNTRHASLGTTRTSWLNAAVD